MHTHLHTYSKHTQADKKLYSANYYFHASNTFLNMSAQNYDVIALLFNSYGILHIQIQYIRCMGVYQH